MPKTIKTLKNYTSKKNIKKWLIDNYTYTNKHNFISGIQLFDTFNNNNTMWEPIQLPFADYYNIKPEKVLKAYLNFWVNMNDVLQDLNWPVEQNFITYTDDKTDTVSEKSDKIQGIFFIINKKDINKNIPEAPEDRILDFGNRMSLSRNEIDEEIDFHDYLLDFRSIEENQQSRNIDKLIAGYPDTNEYIQGPWDGFPTIFRYWRGAIITQDAND